MNYQDEVFTTFRTAWLLGSPPLNGGVAPPVYYEGAPVAGRPSPTEAWVEARVRVDDSRPASAASADGKVIFRRSGIVEIAVRSPRLSAPLADVAKKAFQGVTTSGGVVFRRARAVEVGPDGPWYRWDVVAEFEYDDAV